jgi:dTDP-4-amino-4,6-dideoxygalactose transaminase
LLQIGIWKAECNQEAATQFLIEGLTAFMATATAIQMKVPVLDLKAQYLTIKDEIQAAINSVLENQHFILGPEVKALESEIAAYCGTKYAVGVASGTDALILGLKACGIGPGDEVIVPSFTFIATADAVSILGAKPVFADIQPDTFNIEPQSVERQITPRTRAIIPVHLYGQAADMDPIMALARKHDLKVLEDTAQAIGATYKGRRVASIGDVGCISFFPSKNLGGYGDGGMVVTNSDHVYRRLISLRAHGSTKKYFSTEQGWNSRLDELQAAILRVKLRHLDAWSAQRREVASRYDLMLAKLANVATPARNGFGDHVFHQYTIRVPRRDEVQKRLGELGVTSMVYYPTPIHLQPIYAGLNLHEGDYPVTEKACKEALSLPIFPELTDEQSLYVSQALAQVLAE